MNRLLLLTLLLVACGQKPMKQLPATTTNEEVVVQDTIAVSDIHRTDSLWHSFKKYKRPYVEGYIINQDYVIYQEKNTRKIIKPDMISRLTIGKNLFGELISRLLGEQNRLLSLILPP